MIVVKIELWSAATGKTTTVGVMKIANDGTGTDTHCNYDGQVMRKPDFNQTTREATIEKWPRKAKTVWHLVGAMLKAMGYVK